MIVCFSQVKHTIFRKSTTIAESCMQLNGLLEALKENVPLVLISEAKYLLEKYIRDIMIEPKVAGICTFVSCGLLCVYKM